MLSHWCILNLDRLSLFFMCYDRKALCLCTHPHTHTHIDSVLKMMLLFCKNWLAVAVLHLCSCLVKYCNKTRAKGCELSSLNRLDNHQRCCPQEGSVHTYWCTSWEKSSTRRKLGRKWNDRTNIKNAHLILFVIFCVLRGPNICPNQQNE